MMNLDFVSPDNYKVIYTVTPRSKQEGMLRWDSNCIFRREARGESPRLLFGIIPLS